MNKPILGLAALALTVGACGGPKKFKVTIDSDNLGTQKLTVVYTLPDGNRAVIEPTAVDGHVEFTGEAPEPSTVEIFASSGKKIAEFMAWNGDKITINLTADGITISGTSTQPDSVTVSTPDSVRFEAPRVIVARDSSELWDTEGIWIFTAETGERTEAVMDTIKAHRKKVRDIFVSTDFDTWREIQRRDSANWKQGLLPEGPVSVPALTSTPLLIETDSTGNILRLLPL